jgi:hypothetical protein
MNQYEKNKLLIKLDRIRGQITTAKENNSRAEENLYKLLKEVDDNDV